MNSPVPLCLPCPSCGFSAKEPTKNRDSPFPPLLYSNCPPLDSEASIVRSTIAEAQKELVRVSDEIARIEMVLLDLKRQRERLSHYEKSHRDILSPVRRIPPEILSEIFLNCTLEETVMLEVEKPPWTLGMVCGRWRTVASSSPGLWSSIDIDLDSVPSSRMPIAVFLTETFLMRSARRPLKLFIGGEGTGSQPLLDIIASHSTRWQEVFFYLTTSALQSLNQVRGQLPLLQTLTISAATVDRDPPGSRFPMLNAFEFAPLLRNVHTTNYPNTKSTLALPWPQLRRYRADFQRPKDAVLILHQALNVVECTLYFFAAVTPLAPIPPLQHTRLRRLSVTGGTRSAPCDILGCLTLPALEDIELVHCDGDIADSLNPLLFRSSCSLKKLTLDMVDMVDVDILQLLRSSPLLVELRLLNADSDMITDKLLTELTYRFDSALCLAPHLCSITFSGKLSCNHDLLVDMVESRFKDMHNSQMNPVECLQFVGLVGCGGLELNAYTRLQELRVQGLNVSSQES